MPLRLPPCRAAWLLAGLWLAAAPVRAAEPAESLKLVPADAAFYAASLRNGEQLQTFLNSKAFAKLKALPAVQQALKAAQAQLFKPGGDLSPLQELLRQKENLQLLALLGEMVSDEIFVYGNAGWVDTVELYAEMNSFRMTGRMILEGYWLQGAGAGNPDRGVGRLYLDALSARRNLIQIPELVVGFRIRKAEPASEQLTRLEKLLTGLLADTPLKGRLKRGKVAGGDFLTLTLDSELVPFDQAAQAIKEAEPQPGAYDELTKKLKQLKVTVSLGVRDGYVLLAIGPSTDPIAKLGKGPLLRDRPELKPLAKHAEKPVTSLSYVSKAMANSGSTKPADIDGLLESVTELLAKVEMTDEQRKRVQKDLADLGKEVKGTLTESGATFSFSFLTERGQESYDYDYTPVPAGPTKPLSILNHVGGSPLLAIAGRSPIDPKRYQNVAKWVKKINAYAEEFFIAKLDEATKAKYEEIAKVAHPLFKRFDEITGTMLLPALADGQSALVLDAKWTSKRWLPVMAATAKPLPMLEVGYVRSVSDSALLLKAFREYRKLANDTITAMAGIAPTGVPQGFQIPKAEERKVKSGTLYYWPIPPLGQDEQIVPNLGLSPSVLAFSLSASHSERLLSPTPLKVTSGPLAVKRPLIGATYLDFAGFVDALSPWVEEVGLPLALEALPEKERAAVPAQVRTVLSVLKGFRGYTSATYVEGGVTVTHGETIVRDLSE